MPDEPVKNNPQSFDSLTSPSAIQPVDLFFGQTKNVGGGFSVSLENVFLSGKPVLLNDPKKPLFLHPGNKIVLYGGNLNLYEHVLFLYPAARLVRSLRIGSSLNGGNAVFLENGKELDITIPNYGDEDYGFRILLTSLQPNVRPLWLSQRFWYTTKEDTDSSEEKNNAQKKAEEEQRLEQVRNKIISQTKPEIKDLQKAGVGLADGTKSVGVSDSDSDYAEFFSKENGGMGFLSRAVSSGKDVFLPLAAGAVGVAAGALAGMGDGVTEKSRANGASNISDEKTPNEVLGENILSGKSSVPTDAVVSPSRLQFSDITTEDLKDIKNGKNLNSQSLPTTDYKWQSKKSKEQQENNLNELGSSSFGSSSLGEATKAAVNVQSAAPENNFSNSNAKNFDGFSSSLSSLNNKKSIPVSNFSQTNSTLYTADSDSGLDGIKKQVGVGENDSVKNQNLKNVAIEQQPAYIALKNKMVASWVSQYGTEEDKSGKDLDLIEYKALNSKNEKGVSLQQQILLEYKKQNPKEYAQISGQIFSSASLDPQVQEIDIAIAEKRALLETQGFSFAQIEFEIQQFEQQQWDKFAIEYPGKAILYSESDAAISEAVERVGLSGGASKTKNRKSSDKIAPSKAPAPGLEIAQKLKEQAVGFEKKLNLPNYGKKQKTDVDPDDAQEIISTVVNEEKTDSKPQEENKDKEEINFEAQKGVDSEKVNIGQPLSSTPSTDVPDKPEVGDDSLSRLQAAQQEAEVVRAYQENQQTTQADKGQKNKDLKKLEPIIKDVNRFIDSFLMEGVGMVWGGAIPSVGISIIIGAILGDLVGLFKNYLIKKALSLIPAWHKGAPVHTSKNGGGVIRDLPLSTSFSVEDVAKQIKISGKVKLNIISWNLIVIFVPILFVVIVIIIGCNVPVLLKYQPTSKTYRGSVIGLKYPEVCKSVDTFSSAVQGQMTKPPVAPVGGGGCSPVLSGVASIQSLQSTCFGDKAAYASSISNAESGGDTFSSSRTDICAKDGSAVSFGLFQINISAHKIGSLDCPKAFNQMFTASTKSTCYVVDKNLYDQCVQAAKNAPLNIQAACQISGNGQNWSAWGANKKCGF